ncbi:MAG TPA: amylo-alpha-1,6-glucosidase [Spongiibacteraceae bacterium]
MLPPPLTLPWNKQTDMNALRGREWLTTNGLGGFASGTVLGPPARRYHGMFVPNLSNPKGRFVAIPRIDEVIVLDDRAINLGGAEYIDTSNSADTPHAIDTPSSGEGHCYLREFRLDALMPVWVFEIGATVLEKTLVMPHGQNTVCIRYRVIAGPSPQLQLRVYAAARRLDAVLERSEEWPFTLSMTGEQMEIGMHHAPFAVKMKMYPAQCEFVGAPHIDRAVLYGIERDRGYDHSENLFSPGYFSVRFDESGETALLATTEHWEALEVKSSSLIAAERVRLEQLTDASALPQTDEFALNLVMAADQFIVVPGSRREEALLATASGDQMRSVMAGYHWFNDWGRDTMIALEGLTLCTGRHAEAGAILRTFIRYVKNGLIPNLFPEGEREALYHTVDATLWYFHALDRYLEYSRDWALLRELFPALQAIIDNHVHGTDFGIGMDARDGLIAASAEGYQLTWMDAKVGDWVVTPRRGKPVEIQALWYNALALMASWSEQLGASGNGYRELAEHARNSFNARYWCADHKYLFDVIDGPNGDDTSLRPNQIFALSLRHPILHEQYWQAVVDTVQARLLTPFGLRTLSQDNPNYQGFYQGTLIARDAAYHQGTVWPWLLGHFVDAWLRVHGDINNAQTLLRAFSTHLLEAGIGSISEIFDAESPHCPRGCIAQAWSVAEILRAWLKTQPKNTG